MASEPKSPNIIEGEVVIPVVANTAPLELNKPVEIRIEDADDENTTTTPKITVTNTNNADDLSAHEVPSPLLAPHATLPAQSQTDASGILPKERINKETDAKAAAPSLLPTSITIPRLEEDEANEKDAFLNRRSVNKRKKPHTKLKESQMIIEVQEENVPRKHRYIGRHEPLPEDYIDSRCGKYV